MTYPISNGSTITKRTLSASSRLRSYRDRQRALGLDDSSRRYAREHSHVFNRSRTPTLRTFVGCDGEGCGVDVKGRQLYMLFRMGDRELFTGQPLETERLLDFICGHSGSGLLVGFAFGYDVTMILRDLSERQQRRLFEPKVFGEGHSRYVWFKEFDIDYLPKNYLRVKRVKIERTPDGRERRIPIVGSQQTIYETFGCFQKSFLKAIQSFEVGSIEERTRIAENKARREAFEVIDDEVRAYCALECRMLAEMMEKFRGHCHTAGIFPRSWSGAGKLAAALHTLHETPKRKETDLWVPPEVVQLANMSYYGGRFEITRVGNIKQKVFEYDICSAYPAAMRDLPCLCHGRWQQASGRALQRHDGLFIAGVSFNKVGTATKRAGALSGLPIRSREGHLYWPTRGSGVYWSPEIKSAEKLGLQIKLKEGWTFHCECDCKLFDWVERLYEYRKTIGSQGPGYPLKLGINALYGKLAQRKGNGAFHNMVWAGLITALTRAKINEAIASAPEPDRIVMIATDGVYSLDPLPLEIGDRLGQWETHELDGLFIVQPGLYWSPNKAKKKSRGLSGNFFEQPGLVESFHKAWQDFQADCNSQLDTPFYSVSVPVPGFIGLKLALARNKPELAGTWVKDTRDISFDYRNKRHTHVWQDEHIVTLPKPGYPGLVSLPHRDFLASGGQEPWEAARSMLEEQPDYIDLGPPFED